MKYLALLFIFIFSSPLMAEVMIENIKVGSKLELKDPMTMRLICDIDTQYPQHITNLKVIPRNYEQEESPLMPNSVVVDLLTFEKGRVSDLSPQTIVTMYLDTPELRTHLYTDGHKNCRLHYQKIKNYEELDRLPEFNLIKKNQL